MAFLDALAGGRPAPQVAAMLSPQEIEMLREMGIDPDEYLGGQVGFPSGAFDDGGQMPPPLTVGDAIDQPTDPMFPVEQSLDVAPQPAPQVGVTPESRQQAPPQANGLRGLFEALSFDAPMGQALMAAGFGTLGAQGTQGSTLAALGQGGFAGMQAHGYAKRRQDIEQYKRDQLAAAQEAARTKRIESIISTAEKLAGSGQHAAATKIINSNPDVLEHLNAQRGEIIYGPKPADPKIHVTPRTGRVFSITPTGVRQVGQVDAEPLQGPDPYAGMSTERIFNPETGQTEVVRFDRRGNRVATLGAAPPSSKMSVSYNPETGEFSFAEGADTVKTSPAVVSAAYERLDASDTAVKLADQLLESVNSGSVGLWSDITKTTLGSIAQVDAALGQSISRAIAEATPDLEKAGYDAGKLFNKDKSTVEALGDLLAINIHKSAEGSSRGLTDFDFKTARGRIGLGQSLISPDDVKYRIGLLRDKALGDSESAAARIQELTQKAPAGRMLPPAASGAAKKKTRAERFSELVAGGADEQAAYDALAAEIKAGTVQ